MQKNKKFYSRYHPAPQVGTVNPNPDGGAQQQFREDCNIRSIMSRVRSGTQQMPFPAGIYMDCSMVHDLQSSIELNRQLMADFHTIPPLLRDRFRNDPFELLRYLSDDNNRAEAVRLGIIEPPAAAVVPSLLDVMGTTDTKPVSSPSPAPDPLKGV